MTTIRDTLYLSHNDALRFDAYLTLDVDKNHDQRISAEEANAEKAKLASFSVADAEAGKACTTPMVVTGPIVDPTITDPLAPWCVIPPKKFFPNANAITSDAVNQLRAILDVYTRMPMQKECEVINLDVGEICYDVFNSLELNIIANTDGTVSFTAGNINTDLNGFDIWRSGTFGK